MNASSICILGCGNIGAAIAKGLIKYNTVKTNNIILTKRKMHTLKDFKTKGVQITDNNIDAVKKSKGEK